MSASRIKSLLAGSSMSSSAVVACAALLACTAPEDEAAGVKRSEAIVHTSPWVLVSGWGRGVALSSDRDDLQAVDRLLETRADGERLAVIMERMKVSQRQSVTTKLTERGIRLRPLTKAEYTAAPTDPTHWLIAASALVLAVPSLMAMRLRGRTTRIYELTADVD